MKKNINRANPKSINKSIALASKPCASDDRGGYLLRPVHSFQGFLLLRDLAGLLRSTRHISRQFQWTVLCWRRNCRNDQSKSTTTTRMLSTAPSIRACRVWLNGWESAEL